MRIHPLLQAMSNEPQPLTSFESILSNSIARETVSRLPCSSCKQNTHVRVRRVLPAEATLPPVLVFNAGVRTADELDVWRDGREAPGSRFVAERFRVRRGSEGLLRVTTSAEPAQDGDIEYALKVRLDERSRLSSLD